MAQPQEPIIVFEPNDGLCAYRTPEAAVGHDYGEPRPPPEWFDQLQFFDARGRRLRRVAGSSSGLEVDSEQDHSAHIRERVRRSIEEARQREELEDSTDPLEAKLRSKFLLDARDFLESERNLPFNQVASELTFLLAPDTSEISDSPGRWGHYATADHH